MSSIFLYKILYTPANNLRVGAMYMRLEKTFDQVKHNSEQTSKKRFACAHCGKTWVEIVGIFVGNIYGKEDTYLHIGQESDVCQSCKFRVRTCPTCGSKDAYEINFTPENSHNSPLSFDAIRIVSNS